MLEFRQISWTIAVISAMMLLGKAVKNYLLRKRLLKAVAERRALREKQIKIVEDETSIRAAIVALSFDELLAATQSSKYSAVEVLRAFADKSVQAHKKTNCVVEFVLSAFKLAEELDASGDRSLPLFGIPFSVKECFFLKGHDITLGWVQDLGNLQTLNATFIDALLAYGAIPFLGSRVAIPGRPMACASLGPMSRYPQVLPRIMQLLVDSPIMRNADPYMSKMPWRKIEKAKPLNIGYYTNDGWFQATPACERAVNVVVEQLRASGHNMIPFRPPSVKHGFGLFMGSVTVDGGAYFRRMLAKDIAEPNHAELYRMSYIPLFLRWIGLRLIGGRMFDAFRYLAHTSEELRQVFEKIEVYRQTWVQAWNEAKLDILICPPTASTALPHHYPSKVTHDDISKCKSDYPTTDRWYRLMKSVNSTEENIGLPIGVQVVAMHHNEEMCTHVMELVADANKEWDRCNRSLG